MRSETGFKILDGGSSINIRESNKHFISAYVTDTRLMGVIALYAHWHIDNLFEEDGDKSEKGSITWGDLHQFFYIDCEETGIETYYEVRVSDTEKIEEVEQSLIGGLGAKKIELDETQFRSLMGHWLRFNEARRLPLPEKRSNYDFIFDETAAGSDSLHDLMQLICPKIISDHQLINYFLMRCFGQDREGAEYLTADSSVDTGLFDDYKKATFCRNVIDLRSDLGEDGKVYICDSLVEMNGHYDEIISLVTVKDLAVTGIRCRSISPISEAEAAIIMRKSEYVTVYDIILPPKELEKNLDEFKVGFHTTESQCENGRLFMAYRPNNDHVDRRIFQLSDDVRGIFFVSDHNQLIVSAYDVSDLHVLEARLGRNVLAPYLLQNAKYEFIEPVLYEFVHSDIDYFDEYLSLIRRDPY